MPEQPVPQRGLFVVVEGIDGSGSTTQVRALTARLEALGHRVLATREPSDGPVGSYLRQIMAREVRHSADPSTMALLFAADRRDHLDREILPALAEGQIVICDRYLLSSLAYQGCLLADLPWVRELNRAAVPADLTFLLDLPVEAATARRSGRDFTQIYEHDELQLAVAQAYRTLASEVAAHFVDGCLPPQRITEILLDEVLARLAARTTGEAAHAR